MLQFQNYSKYAYSTSFREKINFGSCQPTVTPTSIRFKLQVYHCNLRILFETSIWRLFQEVQGKLFIPSHVDRIYLYSLLHAIITEFVILCSVVTTIGRLRLQQICIRNE